MPAEYPNTGIPWFDECWSQNPLPPKLDKSYIESLLKVDSLLEVDMQRRSTLGKTPFLENYESGLESDLSPDLAQVILMFEVENREDEPLVIVTKDFEERFPSRKNMVEVVLELAAISRSAHVDPDELLFDRYEVKDTLGSGSYGIVRYAWDTSLHRDVAIKSIPLIPGQSTDKALREARAMAKLNHPSICRMIDSPQTDEELFLVMEFVEGQVLEAWLHDPKEADQESLVKKVAAIAKALAFAHEHKITHRDIKPTNIIVKKDGTPVLLDFGLARDFDLTLSTKTNSTSGTALYMSRQAILGKDRSFSCAVQSDVYSLGVILFRGLSGKFPFFGSSAASVNQQTLTREAPRLTKAHGVNQDLSAIVETALDHTLSRRYSSAQLFADDLDNWLAKRPVSARNLGRWGRGVRWVRRNPWIAATIIALIVLSTSAGHLNVKLKEALTEKAKQNQKLQDRDYTEVVSSARRSASRGAWPDAIRLYTKAIDLRPLDAVPLRVERLRGWLPTNNRQKLLSELDSLESMELKNHWAQVTLIRGEDHLGDATKQEEGRSLVKKALDSGLLKGANAAYAKGLLEEDTTKALAAFDRAIGIEPFHRPAHVAASATLLFTVQFEELGRRLDFMERAFSKDRLPRLMRVWCKILSAPTNTNWVPAQGQIATLVPPSKIKPVEEIFKMVMKIRRSPPGSYGLSLIVLQAMKLKKLTKKDDLIEAIGWRTPAVGRFLQFQDAFIKFYIGKVAKRWDPKDIPEAEKICRSFPTVTFKNMLATLYLIRAQTEGEESPSQFDYINKARLTFMESLESSSLLSGGKKTAIVNAALAEILLFGAPPESRPEGLEQSLRLHLAKIPLAGKIMRKKWDLVAGQAMNLAPRTLTRQHLDTWQKARPKDFAPKLYQIKLELADNHPAAAFRLAQELAKTARKKADREKASKLEAQARAQIISLAKTLQETQ